LIVLHDNILDNVKEHSPYYNQVIVLQKLYENLTKLNKQLWIRDYHFIILAKIYKIFPDLCGYTDVKLDNAFWTNESHIEIYSCGWSHNTYLFKYNNNNDDDGIFALEYSCVNNCNGKSGPHTKIYKKFSKRDELVDYLKIQNHYYW